MEVCGIYFRCVYSVTRIPHLDLIISSALASGPMDILENFKSASPSVVNWSINPLSEGYLFQPISKLLRDRNVSVDQSDSKILLDSINGEGDKCKFNGFDLIFVLIEPLQAAVVKLRTGLTCGTKPVT